MLIFFSYLYFSLHNISPPHTAAKAEATRAMNIAITFLYGSGLWLQDVEAKRLGDWLFAFLGHYSVLAQLTLNAKLRRFPCYPKAHMICHAALKLSRLSTKSKWIISPLATACQQQEDYIGKPSKVSRSTNIRQCHRTILWRSLIKIQVSLEEASVDERGMDSYPDL